VSRGLGRLQRAILDALPAHELEHHPGVYDLKQLRRALALAEGRTSLVRTKYGEGLVPWPTEGFAACFSRAVHSLMQQGILTKAGYEISDDRHGIFIGMVDWHRWQLPYVRRMDKC
jgi:hypothetical protein